VASKDIKTIAELAKGMAARRKAEQQALARRRGTRLECANDPLAGQVNNFAAQHGDYTSHNGRVTNRGGNAVHRWKAAGLLSDGQQAAILHCERLWGLTDTSGRLVANLDRTVFGCPGDGNLAEIEARDDLKRIKGYFPETYWNVFENVCRFDEPAGTAGSRLANNARSAIDAARLCVCMVADMIVMRERLSY